MRPEVVGYQVDSVWTKKILNYRAIPTFQVIFKGMPAVIT